MPDHERQEPAISGYDMRFDDPRMNPIAFLPADSSGDAPREFTHPDGSTYTRVSAAEFESGDDIDSTTVIDDGAPE